MGDIGTHAAHHCGSDISGYITELCADLHIMVEGRALDDGDVLRTFFNNGANGVLTATQVAAREENPLKIRVYGEKADWNGHSRNPIHCL